MSGILKAIQQQGGPTKLGAALGVSKGVINWWKVRGQVPPAFCPEVEKLCCGSVRCEELNDTVDWAYLRGTKKHNRRSTDKPTT
jgi:DNA-binding transcriptional regulator YdaS (Cro superfamily)